MLSQRPPLHPFSFFCLCLALTLLPGVHEADAATVTWDGGGGDNAWSNEDNWDPNNVPTPTDDVEIDVDGVTVTIGAEDVTCGSLVLGNAAGTNEVTLAFTTDSAGSLSTSSGNITIHDMATLEVQRSGTAGEGTGRTIVVAGDLNINAGGAISADGMGFSPYQGPGSAAGHGQGGTHGGIGGNNAKATYGSMVNPASLGGASTSSNGGGAITIQCSGTVSVAGTLSADGAGGAYSGAGGSINISADTLAGAGVIQANGASGTGAWSHGSGGGGRISLDGVTDDQFTGTLQVHGGSTNRRGTAGTIYLNDVRRNDLTLGGAGNLTMLRLGSDWDAGGITNSYTFGNVIIEPGGTLEIDGNFRMNAGSGGAATINVSSLNVKAGGHLSADGLGFVTGQGPGSAGRTSGQGASYGGEGGNNANTDSTYGSITDPRFLGSGSIGRGGGAVILVSTGTVTIDGLVSANSTSANYTGSGGSVNIVAPALQSAGTGIVQVNAANSGNSWSAGGGGRVSVRLSAATGFAGITFQAFGGRRAGGTGIRTGAAGTVYLEGSDDGAGNGDLIIDNNNTDSPDNTLIGTRVTDTAVGSVIIRNTVDLEMKDASVSLTVSGSWTNTANQLLTEGTVTFDSVSNETIDTNNQAFHKVIFDGTGGEWTLTNNPLTANSDLTIADGTLNVDGLGLTVTGTYANDGTLRLHGNETASLTNDTDSGLTIYDGAVTTALPTLGNNTYFDVRFDNAAGDWTLPAATVVNRHLAIAAGILNSGDFGLQAGGDWSNAGTFVPGTAGVTFVDAGLTSTITGTTSFNDFTCVTADKALVFGSGETQTINGTLILNGQAAGSRITIRSTNPGTRSIVDAAGGRNVQFVDVQDSRNLTAPAINPTNSIDRGNTLLWFDLVVTVTATPNPVVLSNPTLLTSTVVGGSGSFTFSWTGPDGFTSNQQSPGSIVPPLLGVNAYTLTVVDTVTFNTIIVPYDIVTASNPIFANPSISPQALVLGQTAMLSSSPAGGSGVYVTFQWTGPNGFTSNLQNPGTITPTNVGANTYTLTVTDSVGLSDTASVTVNVAATALTGNPQVDPAVISLGNTFNLTCTPLGGSGAYTSFVWNGTGGFSANVEDPGIQKPPSSGVWTYTITVTDSYGLTATESVSVFVVESALVIDPSASPSLIVVGEDTSLSCAPYGGTGVYISFQWTGPNGFSSSQQNPGPITPTMPGLNTYTVTVTDASGLVATDSVDVIVGESRYHMYLVSGAVRYRVSRRSTAERPGDLFRIKMRGLELNRGDRVSVVVNGTSIGDVAGGDALTLDERFRAVGQLGSGENIFHKCRIRYKARSRRFLFVAAKGKVATGGQPLVQATSGLSPEVRVAILVDRAPADGMVDWAAVAPLRFKVRARTDSSGFLQENGRSIRK